MDGLNITENSAVPAQTPSFIGGVFARNVLFYVPHKCNCGGERVKRIDKVR